MKITSTLIYGRFVLRVKLARKAEERCCEAPNIAFGVLFQNFGEKESFEPTLRGCGSTKNESKALSPLHKDKK